MNFSVIKTTCILPDSHSHMSYFEAMHSLNKGFNFAEFMAPLLSSDVVFAWIRISKTANIRVNYYIIQPEEADIMLLNSRSMFVNFKDASSRLVPELKVEKLVLSNQELLEEFQNSETTYFKKFSIFADIFKS